MKNRIILLVAVVIIIVSSIVFFLLAKKDDNIQLDGDYIITYSYGGGYGTYISTITKTIELDSNGNVLIYAYVYDEKEVKKYRVSDSEIEDLANEMTHGKFSRLNSDISDDGCLDAGSSTLSIKTKDYEKSVYNYCKYNKTYDSAREAFMNIVGRNKISDFEYYLRDKYEKY